MKKTVKTLIATACVASLACCGFALTACGGRTEAAKAPATIAEYITTKTEKISGIFDGVDTYTLSIKDDGSYAYTTTVAVGSMVIDTTTTLMGKYEKADLEDGIVKYTLKKADDATVTMVATAGGANIFISTTNPEQKYGDKVCELPAKAQGEKIYANNKQDVIDYLQPSEITVWVNTAAACPNELLLTDPNA